MNAHGYLRFTRDVAALGRIGYKPIVPVGAADLADEATRGGWIRDKGMTVLSFAAEYARALLKPLGTATTSSI